MVPQWFGHTGHGCCVCSGAGCRVEMPLHIVYYSVEGGDIGFKKLPVSNPRVFVLVEEGGEIGEIEELVGGGENKCYWANAVTEVR